MVVIALVFLGFVRPSAAAPVLDTPGACPEACTFAPPLIETESALAADNSVLSIGLTQFGEIGAGYVRAVSDVAHKLNSSITPIPAPAAIWLLMAGLGGLGAFRRRKENALPSLRNGAEIEPAGVALRGGSVDVSAAGSARGEFRFAPFRRLRALLLNLAADNRYQAFARGRSSPVRPCGGAGNLYAATAERAPPVWMVQDDFLGSFNSGSKGPTFSFSERLSQGIGFAARFLSPGALGRSLAALAWASGAARSRRQTTRTGRTRALHVEALLGTTNLNETIQEGEKSYNVRLHKIALGGSYRGNRSVAQSRGGALAAIEAGQIDKNVGPNDGVNPVYGTDTRNGYFGSDIYFSGGDIVATYLGTEASYVNNFFLKDLSTSLFSTTGHSGNWQNCTLGLACTKNVNAVSSGVLAFKFTTGGGGSVTNGSNPNGKPGSGAGPNFFVTFLAPERRSRAVQIRRVEVRFGCGSTTTIQTTPMTTMTT